MGSEPRTVTWLAVAGRRVLRWLAATVGRWNRMPLEIRIELRAPDVAHALMAIARALGHEKERHGIRLALEIPTSIRGDGTMANYQLKNDSIDTITIKEVVDATGAPAPVSPGDVFTAASGDTAAVNAVIGTDAAGNPALVINALVQAASGITITVSDAMGAKAATLVVDVVADVVPVDIVLDVADATHAPQPVPAA